MKTQLFLKQFDFAIQVLAFFIPVLLAAVTGTYYLLIFSYLAGGAVQVVSCIINAFALNKFYRNNGRVAYEYTLLGIALVTFIAALFGECNNNAALSDVLLTPILMISPFLAIWYMLFSYQEMTFIKKLVNRKQYV
jgi:hypothetical protein